jgi:hypothetical protein
VQLDFFVVSFAYGSLCCATASLANREFVEREPTYGSRRSRVVVGHLAGEDGQRVHTAYCAQSSRTQESNALEGA